MSSEINVLAHQLDRISERNRRYRDFTLNSLTDALREVIACFPVYRTYIRDSTVLDRDRHYIERAIARAKRKNPTMSPSVLTFCATSWSWKTRPRSTNPTDRHGSASRANSSK